MRSEGVACNQQHGSKRSKGAHRHTNHGQTDKQLDRQATWLPPGQVLPITEVLVSDVRPNPLHHALVGELIRDEGREGAAGEHLVHSPPDGRGVGHIDCVHLRQGER